jgi:hypothetical protein
MGTRLDPPKCTWYVAVVHRPDRPVRIVAAVILPPNAHTNPWFVIRVEEVAILPSFVLLVPTPSTPGHTMLSTMSIMSVRHHLLRLVRAYFE